MTLGKIAGTLKKYHWERICFFLAISVLLELTLFNRHVWLSLGSTPSVLSYQLGDELKSDGQGGYTLAQGSTATVTLTGMRGELKYLLVDIDCENGAGEAIPLTVQLKVADEGNSSLYSLPSTTLYSDFASTKYIRAHSYGDVKQMQMSLSAGQDAHIRIHGIVYDARVPWSVSPLRIAVLFAIITLLWYIRPSSHLYQKKFRRWQKITVVAVVVALNVLAWGALTHCNPAFVEPAWAHHQQYYKLAVALSQGQVNIPVGIEEEMAALANPYDGALRQAVEGAGEVWDTAFYNGKFYVYFGIVPVLLFYLPCYLLFGTQFPTWLGVLIAGAAVLAGAFYLVRQLVKRFFPKTPFLLYVILSVLVGNGMSTLMFMLRPDFYSLPILCAMAFTVWGLGLWLSAAGTWKSRLDGGQDLPRAKWYNSAGLKLGLGSLCMALVAGCRAQFLMGSFLGIFIFAGCVKTAFRQDKKQLIKKAVIALAPYVVVAAGLMYYNAIRFGSPFDFGANYNLTTNDMTQRGFQLGRIADGLYAYLFQFPNLGLKFPYVYATPFTSSYLGTTIKESMFGGVFFTNIVLFGLLAIRKVKEGLKSKGLFGMVVAMLAFSVVIVIADTQMAGILSRYYADFLWLLLIAAVVVILQLWEQLRTESARRTLLLFVVAGCIWGLLMQLGMGIQLTGLESYNPHMFYAFKTFLT